MDDDNYTNQNLNSNSNKKNKKNRKKEKQEEWNARKPVTTLDSNTSESEQINVPKKNNNNNNNNKPKNNNLDSNNNNNNISDEDTPEYSPFLTPEERSNLAAHKYCLDFPLSNEQLQFLDENGYLVLENMIDKELCERIIHEAIQWYVILSWIPLQRIGLLFEIVLHIYIGKNCYR